MEVRVIKNTEPKKANILLAAGIGGLGGYALKHALPLSPEDIQEFTNGEYLTTIKRRVKDVKKAELKELSKLATDKCDNLSRDMFLKLTSSNKEQKQKALANFKNCSVQFKTKIRNMAKDVGKKMIIAHKSEKYVLDSAIKNSRPASVFVVPGVVLGLVGAFVYNVIGKFKESA